MKNLSAPTLIKLIFSIIAFVFIFLILYFVIKSAGYSGRWNCKLAYTLAAPFGLFIDQNTAIQNVALTTGITTAATVGALLGSYFIGRKYNIKGLETVTKKILTNKYFIRGVAITTTGSIATYALGTFINSAISNLQEPIVKNLCKTDIININFADWSFLDIDSCIEDFKKEIINVSKRNFVINTYKSSDEKKLLCLTYKIAELITKTYGETIGTSVRTPFAHVHYAIIIKSNQQLQLSLADLLAVLDIMEINENKTFYEVIYQNSEANANPVGNIYNKYMESGIYSRGFSLNKDKGNVKIISMYYDLTNNVEMEDFVIYDTSQDNVLRYYIVTIKYTGLGEIVIVTTKIT